MKDSFICRHDYPVAETAEGKLRGYEYDGVIYFKGIRYSTAKRFHQPEPVKPWEGVKPANTCGPIAPVYQQRIPHSDFHVMHRYWPMDEECQYVNVWTKDLTPAEKKPVLVWLHGGGFASGSAMEGTAYDCDELAKYGDVVTVSVNHRLNILGFLDLSSFGEEYANSVNAGIADLVEALKWVNRNIAAFGGDPDNVTIFGQSGGGGKVISMLQTPAAAGLFHKAIIISGAMDVSGRVSADHRQIVLQMLKELHFKEDQVKELETVPYDILWQAYQRACKKLGSQINWGPVKNEYYLGYPTVYGFSEYAKKVPVILGTALGEFDSYVPGIPSWIPEEEKKALLDKRFSGHGKEVIAAFEKDYPGKDIAVLSQIDTLFRNDSREFALKRCDECPDVSTWYYIFGLVYTINDCTPTWHSGDIPFFTHTTDRIPNTHFGEYRERLEAEVSGAVISFAKSGNPNHEGLAEWPAYDKTEQNTMIFDVASAVVPQAENALRDLLDKYAPESKDPRPPRKEEKRIPDRIWYY